MNSSHRVVENQIQGVYMYMCLARVEKYAKVCWHWEMAASLRKNSFPLEKKKKSSFKYSCFVSFNSGI